MKFLSFKVQKSVFSPKNKKIFIGGETVDNYVDFYDSSMNPKCLFFKIMFQQAPPWRTKITKTLKKDSTPIESRVKFDSCSATDRKTPARTRAEIVTGSGFRKNAL